MCDNNLISIQLEPEELTWITIPAPANRDGEDFGLLILKNGRGAGI